MCRSHHLVNAHEVKTVRLVQLLCAVCGSNLAGLTLVYIVLPCVAAVVSRPTWRMLVLLIARYVSNLINEHYFFKAQMRWSIHTGVLTGPCSRVNTGIFLPPVNTVILTARVDRARKHRCHYGHLC